MFYDREDYQFDSWVAWLGRALAGPGGDRLVGEAAWLARVLTAADPITAGTTGSAAADLPAVVAPVAPMAAVRIFEYLVRHGTVDHCDALAALVRGLVTNVGADGAATVGLAADITSEMLAPAASRAYPDLAASLVTAAKRTAGPTNAAILAESVARRTDSYALATTRTGWRQGLGLATSTENRSDDDYDALVLPDGRRIPRDDVPSQIRTADDIIALRHEEADDSLFSWGRVIDQQALTSDEVQALTVVFDDGSRRSPEVIAALAEAAERSGDRDTALRLASNVLQSAPAGAWSRLYGRSPHAGGRHHRPCGRPEAPCGRVPRSRPPGHRQPLVTQSAAP